VHRAGRLAAELAKLRHYGLIIVDEVGYLPFERDAANLFFQLVSSGYEHASLVLTSNLPFSKAHMLAATWARQRLNTHRLRGHGIRLPAMTAWPVPSTAAANGPITCDDRKSAGLGP
jgi:DNA replication protein DnaC